MNTKTLTTITIALALLAGCDPAQPSDSYDGDGLSSRCDLDPGPLIISGHEDGIVVFSDGQKPIYGFEIRDGSARCWSFDDGYQSKVELGTMVVVERKANGYAVLWGSVQGLGCFAPDAFEDEDLSVKWREGESFTKHPGKTLALPA